MARLRIDLVAPPFRGHLHPILGLGRALREVATVRVLTTVDRLPVVAASGLEGVGLLAGREREIAEVATPDRAVRGNALRLWRQFRTALALLETMRTEVAEIWRPSPRDLVIVDSVLPSAGFVAQQLGVRWWTSAASPCAIEPRRGAPSYLGGWRHREDRIGRVRDRAGLSLVRTFKRMICRLHAKQLRAWGARGVYRADGSESVYSPECILGLGLAELELPRAWPSAFRFLGPMLYTPPWEAPSAAPPQLEAGRTHVLVTLGTHLPDAKREAAAALRAIAERERRWVVHFSDGDADRGARDSRECGEYFLRYAYVPYDAWLGKFDLVLHHGGAGVMYSCIREKRPALVWPVDFDQFDHAVRIERAGIGRRLWRWRDFPTEVESVLTDRAMQARCAAMQTQLASCRPEVEVVRLVQQAFGQSG